MGVIYKITSPVGKIYIGKTHSWEKRFGDYRCKRISNKKSMVLFSINKYGWDAHTMEIIEECEEHLLNEREIFWIKELKSYAYEYENGMNLTKGGDGQRHSWKHDEERVSRAKMRSGEKSPSWGKKVPEHVKMAISKKVKAHHKKANTQFPLLARQRSVELRSKPVLVYDSNGMFLAEYNSYKNAAIALGLNRKSVNDAANGVQVHSGGYFFRKKTEGYALNINVTNSNILIQKRAVYCLIGNYIIQYGSCNKAAKDLNLFHQTIRDAANRNDLRPLRSGYKFIYKDIYEKTMQEVA